MSPPHQVLGGRWGGLELADLLKRNPSTTDIPIIFLTARDSVDDMVDGLSIGDDYIAKPYSIRNVIARIQAVLRRTMPRSGHGVVCDRASLVCTVDGVPVKLPRKEFEILALFLENPGRIFSREEILKKVWPEQVIVVDRSIDVHVTRIRGKIAPYGGNIITRSGYGYGWKQDEVLVPFTRAVACTHHELAACGHVHGISVPP